MTSEYIVRYATSDDYGSITQLIHSPGVKWFGNIRTKYNAKLELFRSFQTHRLVVLEQNSSNGIIAYAEIRPYPSIGGLNSDTWLEWLQYRYCLSIRVNLLNTLFFNFGIYKGEHPKAIKELLKEIFYSENRLMFLMTVKMPQLVQHDYYNECFEDLEKYAQVLYPREFSIENNLNTQSVYVVQRYDVLPKIIYRKALPEDNDDIIEIQSFELPELRAELGDYYIAEELMRRDKDSDKSYLIVAEIENQNSEYQTAGFMWLSTDIDVKFYVKNYEVEQFGNLVNFVESKSHIFEDILVSSTQPKPEMHLYTEEAIDDLNAITILGGLHANDSGLSVASIGKIKVKSNSGKIKSSLDSSFYVRESVYSKFYYIFETLFFADYYVINEMKIIHLGLNAGNNEPNSDARQYSANVFVLKYIGIHSDYPLKRLFNFLICVFSAFPERDYCIMSIPKTATAVRSHIEVLKYFLPVAKRPSEITNLDDLYITHRSTIHGEISWSRLEKADLKLIKEFTKYDVEFQSVSSGSSVSYASKINVRATIEYEYNVLNQIMDDALKNEFSEFSVLTIRCGDSTKPAEENTLVGYVVLRKFRNHHQLDHHYHVPRYDSHLKHNRGEIIVLRLHPLFKIWSDDIFRDLARKTGYVDFYYVFSRRNNTFSNDLKTHMMLVEPNPMKKIWIQCHIDSFIPSEAQMRLPQHNFYTDHLTLFRHKLKPTKQFGNSSKIVIIGYTDETKAFLRQMAFQWNSKDHKNSETYTCLPHIEVTVIAQPGIVEAEYDNSFRCSFCKDMYNCYMDYRNTGCYVRDTAVRMDLRYWVHFVPGRVNSIDRDKKCVTLTNSCEIYYDTMLLMCHSNFSLNVAYPHPNGRPPPNLIEINSRMDKFMLYYKCRVVMEEMQSNYSILIYGSNLQTYECINFLITHGIPAKYITLVIPHQKSSLASKIKDPYHDTNIQYILNDMITDLGMTIRTDLNFSHWMQHESAYFIMQVVFKKFPGNKEININCDIFISFEEGPLPKTKKKWISASGIAMRDDFILVNKDFNTSDPNIYAVGSAIEIKDEPNYQYRYTNERELAQKLMHILKLGDLNKPFEHKYSQPAYFQAILPLDYFITKVTMPRRYLATQLASDFNYTLTTYKDKTFCRVVLGTNMVVDEIVVVTKDETRMDYLEHFCGKHESLLNNLRARYSAGTFKCLRNFFQEPWTELIMHEDFKDLQIENHNLLIPVVRSSKMKMRGSIIQDIAEKEFFKMNKRFLEQSLINFLRKRRRDFHNEFALPEDYFSNKN